MMIFGDSIYPSVLEIAQIMVIVSTDFVNVTQVIMVLIVLIPVVQVLPVITIL